MAAFKSSSTSQAGSSLHGVAFGLAGFFVFPIHDALAKLLVRDISVWQIMFVRSSVILLLVAVFNGVGPFPRALNSPFRVILGTRACLIVGGWALYYSAARYLPLGELVTIYFGSPILVAFMAGPILRERVTAGRWLAVAMGFIGVLIACRPVSAPRADIARARGRGALVGVHHPDPIDQARGADQREHGDDQFRILLSGRNDAALGMEDPLAPRLPAPRRALPGRCAVSIPGVRGAAAGVGLDHRAARVHEPRVGFIIQYLVWGSPPDAFVLLGALLIGASGLIIISMEWRARARSRLPVREEAQTTFSTPSGKNRALIAQRHRGESNNGPAGIRRAARARDHYAGLRIVGLKIECLIARKIIRNRARKSIDVISQLIARRRGTSNGHAGSQSACSCVAKRRTSVNRTTLDLGAQN